MPGGPHQQWNHGCDLAARTRRRTPMSRTEPVKPGETTCHADLMSASGVGSLIQATVGSFGGVGSAVPEPGRVGGVGGVEGDGPLGADLAGGAVVDRRRGVQPDAGVAVDVVVVIEERGAERAGVFDRAEPAGERRAVLEGLEVRLASTGCRWTRGGGCGCGRRRDRRAAGRPAWRSSTCPGRRAG